MNDRFEFCYSYDAESLRTIANILEQLNHARLCCGGHPEGAFVWNVDDQLCGHFHWDKDNEVWHYQPSINIDTIAVELNRQQQ